jgi:hypothetical protein
VPPASGTVKAGRSVSGPLPTPRVVTRSTLIRIFDRAEALTRAGVVRGARLHAHSVEPGTLDRDLRFRVRGDRYVLNDFGDVTVVDRSARRAYQSVAQVGAWVEATSAEIASALRSLDKPGARWARVAPPEFGGVHPWEHDPLERVTVLPWMARHATQWSWTRSRGRVTWTLRAVSTYGSDLTATVTLDRRGRVVREHETWVSEDSAFRTLRITYGRVARIRLPAPTAVVDATALVAAILHSRTRAPDDQDA